MARRLLIVDDDQRFVKLLRMVLEGTPDFDVVGEAYEGAGALEAARELEPDVVLLDVNLPDTSGFEIAPEIAHAADGLQVVMISSRDGDAYARMAEAAGAAGFVSKYDLSPSALLELLATRG